MPGRRVCWGAKYSKEQSVPGNKLCWGVKYSKEQSVCVCSGDQSICHSFITLDSFFLELPLECCSQLTSLTKLASSFSTGCLIKPLNILSIMFSCVKISTFPKFSTSERFENFSPVLRNVLYEENYWKHYKSLGCFHLVDLIITELKNHMTC